MKRADMETTEEDKGRRAARMTEQRLKETSGSICRNKVMCFSPFQSTLSVG